MLAPGRSLRTNDTVVRDTPARAATSSLFGRLTCMAQLLPTARNRTMARQTPGSSGPSSGLIRSPPRGKLTRVTNAY